MKPLNEVNRTHLGIAGMNPLPLHDSSSRVQMFCSHLSQKLVVEGVEENYIQSGLEQEFAKSNFRISMPVTGRIKSIIRKYNQTAGYDSINGNPETVIVYQDISDHKVVGEFGVLRLPEYFSYHSYFGFNYKPGPALNKLQIGEIIEEGEVFLETPTTTENGGYAFGMNTNVALMSLPETSEDGMIVSESFINKARFYKFEVRYMEWGKAQFPINLYGDDENYKIFPDIGEKVPDDGLLMAFRDINDETAIVDQNRNAAKVVDNIFDNKVYVSGGAEVINVEVVCNEDSQNRITALNQQLVKYIDGTQNFYKRILDLHKELTKKYGFTNLPYSPEMYQLVREALISTNMDGKEKIQKLYRKSQLDHFRVKIVVRKEIVPSIGFKITNLGGCKGVICAIRKDEDMPVDKDGNRADLIMDPKAYVNRMTMSGLYAHFINAVSRDIAKRIRATLGIEQKEAIYSAQKKLQKAIDTNADLVEQQWQYLLSYYQLISPLMHEHYSQFTIKSPEVISNLLTVCTDMVYLYMPVEYTPDLSKVIPELWKKFKPTKGPVQITNKDGEKVWTKEDVLIGNMYIILLEKIGDDFSGVSSSKMQHHGFLAKIGKSDKYAEPVRNQPVRGVGETEGRYFAAYCDIPLIAEIMDRNNNPIIHRHLVRKILDESQPTNIESLIDRSQLPLGASKQLQFVDHLFQCGGYAFEYKSNKKALK